MSQTEHKPDPSREESPQEPVTYASPKKRVLAWVGIVYMLAFVGLNIYPFFTGGRYLNGVAPLLFCPGAAGLLVLSVMDLRDPDCIPSRKACMALLAIACVVIFIAGLVLGIPPLLAGLGG